MAYGTIKVDTVTFTDAGIDKSVTLSGLVQNPTFSGNVTVTGTLSGVTVTGTTANFTSGNFTNISGGTHTITSGVFAAGSAASPSITFTGDLNTGIYSPGADQLAISTNGIRRLSIDSNGYIYGTASALSGDSLNTNGIGFFGGGVKQQSTVGYDFTQFYTSSGQAGPDAAFFIPASNSFGIKTNGNERLRITSAGLVGIGTSSPDALLTVNGVGAHGLGSAAAPSFAFTGDLNTGIYSPGADQLALSTNGQGRVFIDASGNVGVGATPDGLLSLIGANSNTPRLRIQHPSSARDAAISTYFDGSGTYLLIGSNHYLNSTASNAKFDATGGSAAWYLDGSGIGIFYNSSGSGAITERLRITSAGLVGIGTASPLFPLDVNGVIYTRGRGSTFGVLFDDWRIYNSTAPGALVFDNGSERARIDSSGRLLVGTSSSSASYGGGVSTLFQVAGNTSNVNAYPGISCSAYGTTNSWGTISITKSNSNTVGVQAAVDADNRLGELTFEGSNGTSYKIGASIHAANDQASAWGASDCPTRLVFSTTADGASSPTERMRINQAGGTYAVSTDSIVIALSSTQAAGTTNYLIDGKHSGTAGSVASGTRSFRVFTNGNVENTNNSYTGLSDIKLKENIVDANSQWDDIKALRPVNYTFKEGQTHTQLGLIAQEVELVSPGLVTESPDRDAEGNDLGTTTKSVNYSVLYMKAVKALQEAMERIEQLETEMAAVKAQLA